MNLFSPFSWRYVYHYAATLSRQYRSAGKCIADGLRVTEAKHTVYEITRAGEPPSHLRDYDATVTRLEELLRKHELGIRYTVQASDERNGRHIGRIHFRVVQLMPDPSDVPGTPQIKQWVGFLESNPEWVPRLAGTVVCKADSDHAFGAACDDFDTAESMSAQYRSAIEWADYLHCKYVIYQQKIWTAGPPWTRSERGEHSYDGDYHAHVHFSSRDGKCGVYCTPGYGECK